MIGLRDRSRLLAAIAATLALYASTASAQPQPAAPAPAGATAAAPPPPAAPAGGGAAAPGADDTVPPPDAPPDADVTDGEQLVPEEPIPSPTPPEPDPAAAPPPGAPAAPAEEHEDPLHVSGYVQAEYFHNDAGNEGVDAAGRSSNLDLFRVRRGRLKVTYELEYAEFLLQIDATTAGVALRDAEATVLVPWSDTVQSRFVFGLFKTPFGYDLQYSSGSRAFPERSLLSTRFFPGERDVGVQLRGDLFDEMFVYQVAVVNGNPIGDAFFPGIDPNRFKDVVGRLGLHTEHFDFGVSGAGGEGYIAPAADDPMTMMVNEAHAEIDFGRWIFGADARFTYDVPVLGKLDVYGEFAFAQNYDRTRAGYPAVMAPPMSTDVVRRRQMAWYLAAVQNLSSFFQAAVRVEQFDPTFDGADDTITSLTVAALALPTGGVKLTLAYQFFFEPSSVANNSAWVRCQVKF